MKTAPTLLLLAALLPGLAPAETAQFDIPRLPADDALTRFARQSGVPVLFPYDLARGRVANPLRGAHDIEDGLARLLRGTGLVAVANADGQISVRAAPARPARGLLGLLRPTGAAAGPAPAAGIDEITVTGSRIQRDGMTTPTPVTSIHGAELQAMGPGLLADALVQLPQFLNSDTPQSQSFGSSGAAGASFMNLRGIGSSRTLVLLDGRRVVPATRFGAVDLALLPKNLVERIEVVTGGASAAYGSDAVSGVVNLITEDFRGTKLRLQGGVSELGDNANHEVAATWGGELGGGLRLLLSAELYRADGIRGYGRRDWFDSWAAIANPDPAGPAEIVVRDARASSYTYGGLITSGPLAGLQFTGPGEPVPFDFGRNRTALTQQGGSGVDPGRDLVWIQPDQLRASAFARLTAPVGDAQELWLQLLAGHTDYGFDKDPPSQWGAWEATIRADNAFLPEATRARMQSLGLASFRLARVGALDIGSGRVHNRSNLFAATLGAAGRIGGWRYDAHLQAGRNGGQLAYSDTVRLDRVYRAFDSVRDPAGDIVCRSTLTFPDDGCVPANPFGPRSVSPAAREYILEGRSELRQQVTQHLAEATLQRELPLHTVRPSTLAVGGGWRREAVDNRPLRFPSTLDGQVVPPAASQGYTGLPAVYAGQANLYERTAASAVRGDYDVYEAFAEWLLPVTGVAGAGRRLDLAAALRWADYSGSGGVMAWKAGLDFALSPALRLRATRSRDIRAGNLSERFDFSGTGATVTDLFLPGSPSYAITAIRGGNPAVGPEKADALTFGVVLQPSFASGLSMAADYYDIRVHDAIATLGVARIVAGCRSGDDDLCDLINRNAVSGQIASINNRFLNVAEARSRGIDVELGWKQRVHWFGGEEGVALRVFGNRGLATSTREPGAAPVDRAGQTGLVGGSPDWQLNLTFTYQRGPAQMTLQQRHVSGGRYSALAGSAAIDDNDVAGVSYTNLRLAWDVSLRQRGSMLLFVNVTNLFDRDPPLAPDWTFVGSSHTNESLFDVLGRRYVAGLRLRF